MSAALNAKEYSKALGYPDEILKERFVDTDAHLVSSIAYRETGNRERAHSLKTS